MNGNEAEIRQLGQFDRSLQKALLKSHIPNPLQVLRVWSQHSVTDPVGWLCQDVSDQLFVLSEVRGYDSSGILAMRFGPLTGFGDSSNKIRDDLSPLMNQPFGDHEAAGDKVRPDILSIVKHSPGSIELGLCCVWFSNKICIYGAGSERGRHVRGRQLNEPDLVGPDTLILHELANDKVLVAVATRDREDLAAEIAKVPGR